MPQLLKGVQALSVLYDLALTIGSEVAVAPLLTSTLQRLLYHTGFPAGLVLLDPTPTADPAWCEARLETTIGNHLLLKRQGERLRLPAALLEPTPLLAEDPELLAGFAARRPYRSCLRLPIADIGLILLLSPEPQREPLSLVELFMPVMARLANAILLCRRIEERTHELELANRELEAFAYSVSHDLRAPLRAIDGFSRILLEDYEQRLDDDGRHLLREVRNNTARMGQLIDDILAFSRMGRQKIAAADVDLGALARAVFDELRQAAPGRNVRLVVGELPPAHGDRAMLRQVLVNLLSNALKFTQPRAEAAIEVSGEAADGENRYCVRDNGVGFDMQYVDQLFGVFRRLHSSDEFEGTGIGLAIVKRIVERHGGRVWAEGKVGEGAAMHFTLPRRGSE